MELDRSFLEPKGRSSIEVCQGLACREAGSNEVLEALEGETGLRADQISLDGDLGLLRHYCFGLCAIGPNVKVGGKICSGRRPADAPALHEMARAFLQSR